MTPRMGVDFIFQKACSLRKTPLPHLRFEAQLWFPRGYLPPSSPAADRNERRDSPAARVPIGRMREQDLIGMWRWSVWWLLDSWCAFGSASPQSTEEEPDARQRYARYGEGRQGNGPDRKCEGGRGGGEINKGGKPQQR